MTKNQVHYLRAVAAAAVVELIVLVFTLYPMMDGFMVHSAVASAQRPIWIQFLGGFGLLFHFPSILLTFWFPPLAPLVQILIMSVPFYLKFRFTEDFPKRIKF